VAANAQKLAETFEGRLRIFIMRLLTASAFLIAVISAQAGEEKNPLYPPSFASREAAEESARHFIAGCDVNVLHVGNKDVLIYIVHGSGVPDIGIAAYFEKNGAWEFAKSIWPSPDEFHEVIASGKEIVVVGKDSKKQWPFLKVD
jgi:hypothetical protein